MTLKSASTYFHCGRPDTEVEEQLDLGTGGDGFDIPAIHKLYFPDSMQTLI